MGNYCRRTKAPYEKTIELKMGYQFIMQKNYYLYLILNLAMIFCISGCKEISIKPNEQTGYYDTSALLYKEDVKLVDYDIKQSNYKNILYFQTNSQDDKLKEHLINLNLFDKVYDKQDMENLVFELKLNDKVPNISDLVGLHHLHKEIGRFFYLKYAERFAGGYTDEASLKVYDASNGKMVLHLYYKGHGYLYRPLLNAFIDWTKGRVITVNNELRK